MTAWFLAALQTMLFVSMAPLLAGWIKRVKCHMQNRSAPSLLQPYRDMAKLFRKHTVLAEHASWIFRATPYIVLGATILTAAVVPLVAVQLPTTAIADVIVLVGFLAEPALLMVFFTAALISNSTSLTSIVRTLSAQEIGIQPSLALAAVALIMVALAENARVPVDNPATHLELTMVHEALILEYSGRHLALIEWAAALKLFAYACIGMALFAPWGVAHAQSPAALLTALPLLVAKLAAAGFLLALLETLSAKMRIFRVPEFLGMAFMLAVIAMLVRVLLGAGPQ